MKIFFELNGKPCSEEVEPEESLLSLLRRRGCHSVRQGCDTSNCGICTVWLDETPILSCSVPAPRADGHRITTVEGVPEEARALIDALANEGAEQCGFCSPGFIMCALAMFRELESPTEAEIRVYLSGNLCRCTGYASQARALRRVMEARCEN